MSLLLHASLCHLDAVQITDAHGVQGSTYSLCCTGWHSFSCGCGVGVSWPCSPAVSTWSSPRPQRRGEPSALESSGLACNSARLVICARHLPAFPPSLCMGSGWFAPVSLAACSLAPWLLLPAGNRQLACVTSYIISQSITKSYSTSPKSLALWGSVS